MNENKNNYSLLKKQEIKNANHAHKPYWKRMHHSWFFWVFMVLTIVAVIYYIVTIDFSNAPRRESKPTQQNVSP